MKTAKELKQIQGKFRTEVEDIFFALRNKIKELYVKKTNSDECPVGTITLPVGYIYQYIDDQTNEVINAVNTEGDYVALDTGYSTSELNVQEVNTVTLIEIIGDFEKMIQDPKKIEII